MSFKDRYTTADLLSEEVSMKEVLSLQIVDDGNTISEDSKIMISNDAYAIGELLETLINTMRRQ